MERFETVESSSPYLLLARVAEEAERYEDMCSYLKIFIAERPNIPMELRDMMSVGFKNVIGQSRASLRLLHI